MPIPKQISYCWFGHNPLPKKVEKCIESWKKYCPDYEIIRWDESNYDVTKNQYIREAYEAKKWAFVSDYARLDIIYQNGGFYLDTDVELIKSLDKLVNETCVLSIDSEKNMVNTGLGFGAIPRSHIVDELRSAYDNISFVKKDGTLNLKSCLFYTTEYLETLGYKLIPETQRIGEILILAPEYFCPMSFTDGTLNITEDTIGIHWYEMSWFTKEDKHLHVMEARFNRIMPSGIANAFAFLYRKIYRLFEYIRKGILFKKIKEKLKR